MLIKHNASSQPLMFLMVDDADHITGVTGLSPSVVLSKSGGSFAAPSGSVTEVGNGWYKVAGHATDTNTLGPLVLHATAAGADPVDLLHEVVAFDPQAASMGLHDLSSSDVATAVWDAAASSHDDSGSMGEALAAAGSGSGGGDPWITSLPGSYTSGQAGHILGNILSGVNVEVDTALADYDGPTKAELDAAFTQIKGSTWSSSTDTLEGIADAIASGSPPSAADIADAVWDESLTGHDTAGTAGAGLAAAGSAGDPWATLLPGSYTAGQAGKIVGDHLDAAISSRSSHNASDVADAILDDPANKLATDATGRVTVGANDDKSDYELASAPPSAADIASAVWSESTRSLTTFGSLVSDIWAVETRTLTDFSFLTSAGLIDGVLDESLAGHNVSGTVGQALARINDIRTIIQAGHDQ